MIFFNDSFDNLVILFTYMFVYNVSLLAIFWTIFQFINVDFKTLYSFADFKFNSHFLTIVTVTLFSIAGVPPFVGFFAKLFILLALANANFVFFYIFFFGLLFFGLYFYLQNIRFLHSTGTGKINYPHQFNLRYTFLYAYYSFFIIFFLILGFIFFDDLILYFYWLIS